MARHGISYDDVISAANTLKAQGKNVTIENIRSFLGTGSSGTINQHLRHWKEAQQSTQKIASKENLPEGLIALVKGLWEGVLAQSAEQFVPIESNYQQEIAELKAELEKYRGNNQRWQNMFNQWQQEKTKLVNEKLALEQALDFAHKENQSLHGKYDGLLQQLQEKQERIEELHRLHQQTQANLEHYRESAREQRLLDQQQFEQQKLQLQFEVKTFNDQSIIHREKISELEQQNQESIQKYFQSDKNHKDLQLRFEQIENKLKETEKAQHEHIQSKQHWQSQFQEIQKILENKASELVTIQTESKILSQQLEDTKHSLHNTESRIKLLADDKWILVQEKAQLEGQLKQMQKIITA